MLPQPRKVFNSFFDWLRRLFRFVEVDASDEATHAEDDIHGEGKLVREEK